MNRIFFIEQLVEVYGEQCGLVQFLQQGYKNVFRWPRVDDVADTEAQFIFYADFECSSLKYLRQLLQNIY